MPFGFSIYRRKSQHARKLSTTKSFESQNTPSSADEVPLVETAATHNPKPAPWRRNSDPHNLKLLAANANDIQLVSMSRPVTLTFSSPGAKPPIYVAGTFTRPPWTAVEMDQAEDAPNGDPVFVKTFDDVDTGEYQYKYRLGTGDWWILNEKVETAMDSCGNRNNILRVFRTGQQTSHKDRDQKQEGSASQEDSPLSKTAEDAGNDDSPPNILTQTPVTDKLPVPFTVVEMAPDLPRPEYGDVEGNKLNEDSGKRSSDADPDVQIEASQPEYFTQDPEQPRKLSIPTLVVQKTDDLPTHGDDFGQNASFGQRHAHELRAADSKPDHTVTLPTESGKIEESNASTSSHDTMRGTSDEDEGEDEEPAPLFRHETIASGLDEEDDEPAPLFRHETIAITDTRASQPDIDDEEEPAPLFRHETIDPKDPAAFRRQSSYIEVPESPFTPSSSVEDMDEQVRETARNPDPVGLDNGMPLFSHEYLPGEQDSRSRSQLSGRSKSGTSLQMITEDQDDVSIEEFPTDKAEIAEKLSETKQRLSKDDSTTGHDEPLSLLEPGVPSEAVNQFAPETGAISPLEPISEDVTIEEVEPLETAVEEFPEPVTSEPKRSESKQPAPPTPPKTPVDDQPSKDEVVRSTETPKQSATADDAAAKRSIPSESSASSKNEGCSDDSHSIHRGIRPTERSSSPPQSHKRAASPSSVRSAQVPQRNDREGFFAAFWRVCFGSCIGSIGRWLAQIFGSRRNAT